MTVSILHILVHKEASNYLLASFSDYMEITHGQDLCKIDNYLWEISMKHGHFKTLSVPVSDTLGILLHTCPNCIGREKNIYLFTFERFLWSTDTSKLLAYPCPTHWGYFCIRVLIVLEGKKIFTYLKKFLLIINMFLKILIVVIYVNNLK